jgi:hypothetical protein
MVDASASSRIAVLATSLYLAGVVIVRAVGQTMRTAAGMESGWINSTVIGSAPLIWPWLSVVFLDTGSSLFQVGDPQPRREFAVPGGALLLFDLAQGWFLDHLL